MLGAWQYAGPSGWNDVGWSVSAEWFAYVFFPLFLLAAPRLNKARIAMAGCLALAALAAVEATAPDHLSLSGGVVRLVPEFLLGVLLCRLREAMPRHNGFAAGGMLSLAVCVLGVGLGLDVLFVAARPGWCSSSPTKRMLSPACCRCAASSSSARSPTAFISCSAFRNTCSRSRGARWRALPPAGGSAGSVAAGVDGRHRHPAAFRRREADADLYQSPLWCQGKASGSIRATH